MLKVLRRIVQEINEAANFAEALNILVTSVREAIETQACSIFLVDPVNNEYVLSATQGLNKKTVGKVRLKSEEGLIGLVGSRGEVINLEDAPTHPHFFHCPEISEDKYRAFLGAPIIHNRRLLGVMIIQQEEKRRFDESEEAFLLTISSQLGPIIAQAEAAGHITDIFNNTHKSLHDIIFDGVAATTGIAVGSAVIVYPPADLDAIPHRKITAIKREQQRVKKALRATHKDIVRLSKKLAGSLPVEEFALFDAYLRILDSASLEKEILNEIEKGQWAQGALRKVIEHHVAHFEAMDDDYLRERAADLRDLGRRILLHLQSNQKIKNQFFQQTILVGEEVTAADLALISQKKLQGIISVRGSYNSHAAILARALNIPMITGIETLPFDQIEHQEIIIDGFQGQVYLNPSPRIKKIFSQLQTQQRAFTESLQELRDLPAQTKDDHRIALWVNTGLPADAKLSLTAGAEGVGLYRSEIPFMNREYFPSEEEQQHIYRKVLHTFSPRPVVMRTLDIGGDKALPYFPIKENNPFLGWRGIRITLDHPEIFLMQLRAMLKANENLNNLRIMLPMISSVNEIKEALRLFEQAFNEVTQEGHAISKPPIGIMLEVPSAIYQIHALLRYVDFVSVGSNDLTQYLLAVDRNNTRVAPLYDALHPAVLRALYTTVKAAHQAKKPISICGEIASDPVATPLLLAMGFDAFSMNPAALPRIKWVIRNFHLQEAKKLLRHVMKMESCQAIRSHMENALLEAELHQSISLLPR